jgi:hypothetical protein
MKSHIKNQPLHTAAVALALRVALKAVLLVLCAVEVKYAAF